MTDLSKTTSLSEEVLGKEDACEIYCFDEPKVNRLVQQLDSMDTNKIVILFKALADDTRFKIAICLAKEEELCVCDVANVIGSSVATASHHLRLLRNMGLAKYRKEGKLVFYALDNDHIRQLILLSLANQGFKA